MGVWETHEENLGCCDFCGQPFKAVERFSTRKARIVRSVQKHAIDNKEMCDPCWLRSRQAPSVSAFRIGEPRHNARY